MSSDEARSPAAERLGSHLRRLRRQKGLSLLDVQALSEGTFKASVLGAYERGERAISAIRLSALASLYRLPLQAMLPSEGASSAEGSFAVDLAQLERADTPEAKIIARFIKRLQAQRRDWTGTVFRMRTSDGVALAAALDRTPADVAKLLDELGIRAH
jgi:transcriptional regulator with XRE-family HTH domain